MKKVFPVFLISAALTACINFDESNREVDNIEHESIRYRDNVSNRDYVVEPEKYRVDVHGGFYVGTDFVVDDKEIPADIFDTARSFVAGDAMSLTNLISYLKNETGITFTRSFELVPRGDDLEDQISIAETQDLGSENEKKEEEAEENKLLEFVRTPDYSLNHRSITLRNLLDDISSTMGIQWTYSKSEGVHFFYYLTESFVIAKTGDGGNTEYISTTDNTTDSENGGSQGRLKSEFKFQPQFWLNTLTSIENMRSPYGRVVTNSATGSVTVTDSPDFVETIGDYIKTLNDQLALKAHVKFTTIKVTTDSSQQLNLSLSAAYAKSQDYVVGFTNPRTAIQNGGEFNFRVDDPNSRWNGSQVFLDALDSATKLSILNERHYLIRNHSVFNYTKGDVLRYLESASVTNTSDVGSTEGTELGEQFLGFGLAFYPRIYDKSKMVFNVMLDQVDLIELESIEVSSELTSQVPQITKEGITTEYDLRSGETVVLAALDLTRANSRGDYVAGQHNCIGGCSLAAGIEREYILHLMSVELD